FACSGICAFAASSSGGNGVRVWEDITLVIVTVRARDHSATSFHSAAWWPSLSLSTEERLHEALNLRLMTGSRDLLHVVYECPAEFAFYVECGTFKGGSGEIASLYCLLNQPPQARR